MNQALAFDQSAFREPFESLRNASLSREQAAHVKIKDRFQCLAAIKAVRPWFELIS